jgi:hypothetical protein
MALLVGIPRDRDTERDSEIHADLRRFPPI